MKNAVRWASDETSVATAVATAGSSFSALRTATIARLGEHCAAFFKLCKIMHLNDHERSSTRSRCWFKKISRGRVWNFFASIRGESRPRDPARSHEVVALSGRSNPSINASFTLFRETKANHPVHARALEDISTLRVCFILN